ncbi:AFG2-interacting ribosome maturation factor [Gastrophryne carolinensis]
MSEAALLSVQQSLRRSFDNLEKEQREWKLAIVECDSLVATLGNLAEQLQVCKKTSFAKTPLSGFPDLQDRLCYKLQAAMDLALEKLSDKMCILQRVRDSVSHQVGSTLHIYEINAEKLGLDASLTRSALSPSVADMLEWLQDIERNYRNQYIQQKLMLHLDCNHLSVIKNLPQAWRKLEEQSAPKQQLIYYLLFHSFVRLHVKKIDIALAVRRDLLIQCKIFLDMSAETVNGGCIGPERLFRIERILKEHR